MRFIQPGKSPAPAYNPGLWPALEWSSEFWTELLDNIDIPVVVLSEDGTALLVNAEAATVLDLAGAVGHRLPGRLSHLLGDPGQGRRLVTIQTPGGPWLFTVKAVAAEGHERALVASGEREGARPESAGEGASESAAMAGEMGQKVKGPLAGIELYASILDEEVRGRDQEDLSSIIDEIRHSVREVNEYLTSFESMTRILSLRLEELSLASVVDEALGALGDLFKAKGVGVLVDQRALTVLGDRKLLVQLFLNVILNAVEAMPTGGRLMVDIRENAQGQAEVVVTDTGPGVDMRRSKEIFNPFFTTKDQPLGLGLPVSRRVAEAHGGRIVVGTDVTLGARVSVTLPCLRDGEGEAAKGLN
jgi:signal transduction histidine kinase